MNILVMRCERKTQRLDFPGVMTDMLGVGYVAPLRPLYTGGHRGISVSLVEPRAPEALP